MVSRAFKITYKYGWGDKQYDVELPLKLLVIGDFTRRSDDVMLRDRKVIRIDKVNFNEKMADHKICLKIRVNKYLPSKEKGLLDVKLNFTCIDDFKPYSIVKQVPEIKEFIKAFDDRKPTAEELDVFCKQLDAIFHHPDFQQLEASWRGLKFLVDRKDFSENIKIELLNISKEDLFEDFEHSHKITQSGFFQKVYTDEYFVFGGEPYGAIIANYEFGFSPKDIRLLQYIAYSGAMSHCPFIASAGPKFFGIDDFSELHKVKDIESHFDGAKYIKWQSFRESDDARNIALAMPRFLLRLPYDSENNPFKAFNYNENVSGSHEDYLWGNAAFAFATNLTKSFAKYRWCVNIIGPQGGGEVEDLPLHQFDSIGGLQTKIPTEVYIPDRREYELSEEGFMALAMLKNSDDACFFSANSIQKPKIFPDTPEGRQAFLSYKLVAQLPHLFFITRFAHYIKVLYKTKEGMWSSNKDLLQEELNNWIGQYKPGCQRRPIRTAQIVVEDCDYEYEGYSPQYRFLLKVCPDRTYMGKYFNLSLVGILR
jgi:type VI secretion system protein ImpC